MSSNDTTEEEIIDPDFDFVRTKFLLIDGENVRQTITKTLKNKEDFLNFDIYKLLYKILPNAKFSRIIWYCAKAHFDPENPIISQGRIKFQRKLFNILRTQGIEVNVGGRLQKIVLTDSSNNKRITYKEKGVDVQIAVDILTHFYENGNSEVYLFSSDTDLIPAIKHVLHTDFQIFYVATELQIIEALKTHCHGFYVISGEDLEDVFGSLKDKTPILR